MKRLKYKDIYKGLRVIDTDFSIEGVIEKCDNPHNIIVRNNDNTVNLYCLVEDCKEGMYDNSLIKK